jgi:hypothetical protein
MKSIFQHLVVSGCSFTTNEHMPWPSDRSWPNTLARDTGMTVHNLATSGAGNSHISRSIIVYLEKNKLPIDKTLVIAMWSGVGRIDFTVSNKLSPRDYSWNYFYTPQCRLHQGGHWWNITRPSIIDKTLIDFSKHQDDYTMALETWVAMTSLESYLKCQNVKYFFTSFLNFAANTIYFDAVHVDLDQTLASMGLKIDYSNWLNLAPADYYGDWCTKRGLLVPDGFHPGLDGPQRWPREVLMPLLQQQGILT